MFKQFELANTVVDNEYAKISAFLKEIAKAKHNIELNV